MGKSKTGRAARRAIAFRLKTAARDWAYEIEDSVRSDMRSWSDIEDEDEFRKRVEAYATQWIDDSLIYTDDIIDLLKEYGGTQDLEQLFFDEFFDDFLDEVYSDIDYESLWEEYMDEHGTSHEAARNNNKKNASLKRVAFDDAPEYAIADKYRDFDAALQYVNMSDDEIIRESAKYAAYDWFGWSGSFKSISDTHFRSVVWDGIDRVARNIFSAQERVKAGVETDADWRALRSADPEAWESLRDDIGIKIDERCEAIEPIVSQLLLDAIEDCRARIESI